MADKKSNNSKFVAYSVLRCPFVKNDAHRCNQLCSPVAGFGLCGRRAEHEPPRQDSKPRVVFMISRDKAA